MTKIYTNTQDGYFLTVNKERDERKRYYFNRFSKEDVEEVLKEEGENYEWCD